MIHGSLKGKLSPQEVLKGNLANEVLRGYSAYQVAVFNGFEGTEEEWLESLQGGGIDLSEYAKKDDIPTDYAKKEHEHEQYLTEHQSLKDYALKSEIPTDYAKENHKHTEYLTEHQDLSNYALKKDIPTDYATKVHTHDEYLTEHQDLSDYALKSDIPTDYAPKTHTHSQYANKEHTHSQYLTEHQSLEEYAKKVDIPTDYAKKEHAHSQYLTEHQDLSSYAKKSDVTTHNTSNTSHNDIRLLIEGLTSRLNALANSDDTTLDQMAEVVAYIKNNKSLIDNITTSKVNVSDIVDNLETMTPIKPLSAKQGVELKAYIDTLTGALNTKAPKEHEHSQYLTEHQSLANYYKKTETYSKTEVDTKVSSFNEAKANKVHTHEAKEIDTSAIGTKDLGGATLDATLVEIETLLNSKTSFSGSYNDLTNKPSIPTKVSQLTNDSKYVTETGLSNKGYATATNLNSHINDTTKHITSTERTTWNNKSNFSGSYNDLTNKPTIPSKTSQLTNDSGYVKNTSTETWTFTLEDGSTVTKKVVVA